MYIFIFRLLFLSPSVESPFHPPTALLFLSAVERETKTIKAVLASILRHIEHMTSIKALNWNAVMRTTPPAPRSEFCKT